MKGDNGGDNDGDGDGAHSAPTWAHDHEPLRAKKTYVPFLKRPVGTSYDEKLKNMSDRKRQMRNYHKRKRDEQQHSGAPSLKQKAQM